MKIKSLPLLFVALLTLAGCGYELVREPGILANAGSAKSASGMTEGITSLNVPVFRNPVFRADRCPFLLPRPFRDVGFRAAFD